VHQRVVGDCLRMGLLLGLGRGGGANRLLLGQPGASSSASRRARSSAAAHTAWPSAAMSPIALVINAQDRMASSLPGTM